MLHDPAVREQAALDIVRSDETLLQAFLLRHATESGSAAFTDENASRFLLWFALEGRYHYQLARFSPAYSAFLAQPIAPFASRLAAYVLTRRPDIRAKFGKDPDAFHAWYYLHGVSELGIGMFVSPREQMFLAQTHPKFASQPAPLTRRAYYTYLRDAEARRMFDLRLQDDRERLAMRLAQGDGSEAPPWLEEPPATDGAHLPGVNVVGFADGILGIGEDARALVRTLGAAGIMRSVFRIELHEKHATSDKFAISALAADRPVFPVNIFALTAFETARLRIERGANLFEGRYNIGYWPWELTSLPPDWHGVFDLVDEVWASSDFLFDVYSRMTDKPVHVVPPFLNVPDHQPMDLGQFGLSGDAVVFLTMFDFNSYVARKNPAAAIKAFRAAFPDRNGRERMIVKTLNAHAHLEKLAGIESAIGDDDRFVLIDGPFSRAEVCGLIAAADCFVSLHRSEGFGRVVAEAMLLGTAVIATGWSGNCSFLRPENGYPVRYELRDVRPGEYVFSEGSQWAEPSMDDAIEKFRIARARMDHDATMRDAARTLVSGKYGLEASARAVRARLEAIVRTHRQIS
jgi:glycosyltransferase involved in cell wall biosynthesis